MHHGPNQGYGGPPHYPQPPYPQPASPDQQIHRVTRTIERVLAVGLAIGVVLFLGGVFAFVFFFTRPRGEKVGEVNLGDPSASVAVDAVAGEALFFRTDVSVAVPALDLMDSDARERQIDKYLRSSTLTIRAKSPSGQERVATCPVYNGRAGTTSTIGPTFSRSGMLNDCTIAIDAPGRWLVKGSVDWAPALPLKSAGLETRREKASR